MKNTSTIKEFIFLGFPKLPSLQTAMFYMSFTFYTATLIGNSLIIIATIVDNRLHVPMYFFLSNLAFLDIVYTTVTIPKMLLNFLWKSNTISFYACATQMYFFIAFGSIECTLLAVMAYDRYVAICLPLNYVILMETITCITLVFSSWISGFLNSMIHTVLTFHLPYCSSNKINQFFCDIPPLLKVACANTLINKIVLFTVGGIYGLGSFLLTLISYTYIISTILKIRSKEGQRKSFSTCASHLIVVTLFYGTSFFMYLQTTYQSSMELQKLIPVLYTVVTPTLNPIIYTLRNQEFKSVLKKMIEKNLTHKKRITSEYKLC
ncbi:olfactory receptor 5V1-like [Bombina bombina]|uniref:olfactory receptor 5V1-like n=1 Tax=Bombina bombina TaxID=8345 RepID=UPI00235AB4DB|nr:olfactory receptor 5V1-like [Bombina bombina]